MWSTMLDLLVSRLARTRAFIESLPAGVLMDERGPDSLRDAFRARLDVIREELSTLSVEAFVDDLADAYVRRMTLPPDDQLEGLFSLDAMTLDTELFKRPRVSYHLTQNDEKVTLVLPGGYTVSANARAEPAIRHVIAADRPYRVREMHECLSDAAKLTLAKKLVSSGLLGRVSTEPIGVDTG
jgi:hypothetical protein